jgi:hypothetical protein
MEGWMIGVAALGLVAAVTLFILWRKKKQKAADAWKQGTSARAFAILKEVPPVITPAGHKVYFEKGTDPSVFSIPACDAGIEKTFNKCECAGYQVDRSAHIVSIVVLNSIPDSAGDPAFKVFIGPASPYFGSQWDKEAGKGQEVDHYILAAGQTIAVGAPYGDVIAIPHHSGKEAHLSTVCEYEAEHFTLARYDGPKFEQTKEHLTGGHPLLADCPGMAMFTSRPFKGICAGMVRD